LNAAGKGALHWGFQWLSVGCRGLLKAATRHRTGRTRTQKGTSRLPPAPNRPTCARVIHRRILARVWQCLPFDVTLAKLVADSGEVVANDEITFPSVVSSKKGSRHGSPVPAVSEMQACVCGNEVGRWPFGKEAPIPQTSSPRKGQTEDGKGIVTLLRPSHPSLPLFLFQSI
jgi:hypothetical protein